MPTIGPLGPRASNAYDGDLGHREHNRRDVHGTSTDRGHFACGRYAQTDPLTTMVVTVLTVAILIFPASSFINL